MAKYTAASVHEEVVVLSNKLDTLATSVQTLIGLVQGQAQAPQKGKRTDAPKPMVDFVKKDGTVVQCSAAQAEAWEKARNAHDERVATYSARREAFVKGDLPQALVDAIRKDRAKVTAQVARSLGFVGTKNDLKVLKEQILSK